MCLARKSVLFRKKSKHKFPFRLMYLTCQRTENVRVVRRKGQRGTKGGEVILCRILKTILRSLPFILRWEIMKGFEQKRVMINLCFNIIILASMLNIYTGGNGGMMETSYKIFTLIQGRKNSRLDNGVNCGHEEPCSDSGYISGRLIGFVGRPTTCYEKKGKPIFWPEKLEEWNCHLLR